MSSIALDFRVRYMVIDFSMLKLIPVLVPKPLWGINAHDLLAWETWQHIRRDTFAQDNHVCVICEQQLPLECHEVFSYDDTAGVAVLEKLESRCTDCHACNHLGRLRKRNPDEFRHALVRIGRLNKMKPEEVVLLVKEAFRLHSTRTKSWELKVAPDLLRSYPELARLEGRHEVT